MLSDGELMLLVSDIESFVEFMNDYEDDNTDEL